MDIPVPGLQGYLAKYGLVDDDVLSTLTKQMRPVNFKKRQIVFHQGQVQDKMYFLPAGIVRYFITDGDGVAHTMSLALGSDMICSTRSFHTSEPSPFSAYALHDAVMYEIPSSVIRQLHQQHLNFANFYIQYLEEVFMQKEAREHALLCDSATQRYLTFANDYADYLSLVPKRVIASYIGITPEALSRILRRLKDENE